MKLKLATIFVLFAMPAQAAFLSGNELYASGTSPNHVDRNNATLYAIGVADAVQVLAPEIACIPETVTGQQIGDIVIRVLAEHPELRHHAAIDFAIVAIADAFPCGDF